MNGAAGNDGAGDSSGNGLIARLRAWFAAPRRDRDGFAAAAENGEAQALESMARTRREMIERVVAFDQKQVVDVMAPRADISAVDIETTLDELIQIFADAGHSRLPVYRGDLDDPIGMVHIKDVVGRIADRRKHRPETPQLETGPVLQQIHREILYAPPSMRITDLLLRMQASHIHMALVIDEYGGTDGLVTIEDLVEEIVGDINDEHDEEETPTVAPHGGGGWIVDARVELEEFAEETGVHLEADDDEIDTVGGYVVSLAGRVPQRGEVIVSDDGFDVEVIEADARKVRRLRIRPSSMKPSEAAE
jgi:hemolysin (HlyC) family protein